MGIGGWPNRHITFIVAKKLNLQFILLYLRGLFIFFQGIAIFYLFCVRHVKARRLWWDPLWNGLRRYFSQIHITNRTQQFRHLTTSKNSYDFKLKEKNADSIKAVSETASGYHVTSRDLKEYLVTG